MANWEGMRLLKKGVTEGAAMVVESLLNSCDIWCLVERAGVGSDLRAVIGSVASPLCSVYVKEEDWESAKSIVDSISYGPGAFAKEMPQS
ncbi:MAG: hypothetical protein LBC69_03930 [Eubacteriaceae bacterium]|jgi:hypothetical protein|nr:hypothetical protein [Eubacteriaceae bacterium]